MFTTTESGRSRPCPQPIWLNLAASRTETLREMKRVYRGRSPELERTFRLQVRPGGKKGARAG